MISADFCTLNSFILSKFALHARIKCCSEVDGFSAKQILKEYFK